ncbi:phosphonate C-P lyase system protein PhnL [Aestuariispira insulae]|uniref:Alpha-D-ribose 1-methylphosphonate 5-triphosphate synthase subunit PhnL n=1 Tax=Aestuariispira insulae TaxID=1461337 RepID=A0A3D9H6U4_9PROT|nr:phosphonate C-P lyase system protein PhnL [Aestuariispira insulae]RED44871.1 alpha-D-ribose 1-methylphosphonate 5-triphosphate synthase subunit PhnL [Aestuariispira insulae]
MQEMLITEKLCKSFTLHVQNGTEIPVFENVEMRLEKGECVALTGASGAGKSTFMRMIYANYRSQSGSINIRHGEDWVDMVAASPHRILEVRRKTLGYVSQFLRVIPRTPTLDIVAEPLRLRGEDAAEARQRAAVMLERLNVPETLWSLSPMTFSGGEQQRVNIARGFIANYPVMLLDEPTASLDQVNRQVVLDLIDEAKARGAAILGIFHDQSARAAVCDREFDITSFKVATDA